MKPNNKSTELNLLKKIYSRTLSLAPEVTKIAVDATDSPMNMQFLNLDRVCYITSRSATGRTELMTVTDDGSRYYNNRILAEIERNLIGNPHFMRTSRFYIINLAKITGMRFSAARDLWFTGSDEPVINAVSEGYLAAFLKQLNLA